MVIPTRYRLVGIVALAATGLSIGGCQTAVTVGAVNRCDAEVRIQADTVTESSTAWITLGAGDRGEVVDVPEDAETLYVRVRTPGAEPGRAFDLPMASLASPSEGADYEAELLLEGDRCP